MEKTQTLGCAVCGQERSVNNSWFLMVESLWQDKVKILHWHDQLALQAGVHHVCSAAHVQELVVHWMTIGSLDYPFARTKPQPEPWHRAELSSIPGDPDTRGARQIGELAIHRESIERLLRENPHSLTSILDALLSALERDPAPPAAVMETKEEEFCGAGQST